MANPNFCHFCGRSDSLNLISEVNARICSKCWEMIAHVCWKLLTSVESAKADMMEKITERMQSGE